MARDRRRLVAWLLAGLVLAVVLALYDADRTGVSEPAAGPTAGPCPDSALRCPGGNPAPGPVPSPSADPSASGSPGPPTSTSSAPSSPGTGTGGGPGPGPGGGPCSSPGACGFPDAGTTGPRIALERHDTGDLSVKTDGMVIKGWDIRGSLDVYANDVTVIDSRITSANWWGINLRPGFSGLRVLHTTITAVPGKGPDNGGVDYAVSNMGGSSIEVGWCDVSVFGNALSMGQGEIHDTYVHDIVPFRNQGGEWQHTDAVISGGGNKGRLTIRHNTLLNPVPVHQGASAAVGLFADTGNVSSVVVDGNWLAGGAYALYGGGPGASGIQVTDNVFSAEYHPNAGAYGLVAAWNAGGAGNVWRGNRTADGRPVVPEPSP
ncbi:lipoprotein [Streptomyces roseus]|uniref:Lipoprotein n=1 Tax=Streptomyces roseus TaxID=66430 RepID=A0A0J6XLQ5_9ACTN|nr:lipoprotein [Streptomyces roseus]KMO96139.1 lipoprotein [Streptomyces roseus]